MKIIINLLIALLILICRPVSAQQDKQGRINHIAREFGVSAQQAGKIDSALHFNHVLIMRAMKDQTLPPLKRHELLKKLMMERDQKIKEELTPAQLVTLRELMKPLEQRQAATHDKIEKANQQSSPATLRGAALKNRKVLN